VKPIALILFFVAATLSQAQVRELIPEKCHNRWGYVDREGHVKIDYVFNEVGRFSDGLAMARIGGRFGYIDTTGKFVIPELFTEAGSFSEGFASVNLDGRIFVIDKNGHQAFDCSDFKGVYAFKRGKAIVITHGGARGVIDRDGKYVLQPLYDKIDEFHEGLSIVRSFETDEQKTQTYGVIDSAYHLVVPLGIYEKIDPFENGYAVVRTLAKERNPVMGMAEGSGIINTKGKLLFSIPATTHCWVDGTFHEGFARVTLFRKGRKRTGNSSEDYYEGFVDTTGKTVFDHSHIKEVWDYSCGRAFVGDWQNGWRIIDRKGEFISPKKFSVLNEKFKDNIAIVKEDFKWGFIDTNGNYLVKPVFEEVNREGFENGLLIVQDARSQKWGIVNATGQYRLKPEYDKIRTVWKQPVFFIGKMQNMNFSEPKMVWGVADTSGKIWVEPQYTEMYEAENGWIQVETPSGWKYITFTGQNVDPALYRQETGCHEQQITDTLNITDKCVVSFDALSSPELNEPRNGNGQGSTRPTVATPADSLPVNNFGLMVRTNESTTTWGNYAAMQGYIFNTTGSALSVPAIDGNVYVTLEAKNEAGGWTEISYIARPGCGNSYHHVLLGSKQYWKFSVPVFKGAYKTTMRLSMKVSVAETWHTRNEPYQDNLPIYSNEFEGYVNPGQFAGSR
jgi:hypothetical protein